MVRQVIIALNNRLHGKKFSLQSYHDPDTLDVPVSQLEEWRLKTDRKSYFDNFRMVEWDRRAAKQVHRISFLWDPYLDLSNERLAENTYESNALD